MIKKMIRFDNINVNLNFKFELTYLQISWIFFDYHIKEYITVIDRLHKFKKICYSRKIVIQHFQIV